MSLYAAVVELWCVMHAEPSQLCDYDFFDTEEEARHYAENILGNAEDDGVPIRLYVMKVHWSTEP